MTVFAVMSAAAVAALTIAGAFMRLGAISCVGAAVYPVTYFPHSHILHFIGGYIRIILF